MRIPAIPPLPAQPVEGLYRSGRKQCRELYHTVLLSAASPQIVNGVMENWAPSLHFFITPPLHSQIVPAQFKHPPTLGTGGFRLRANRVAPRTTMQLHREQPTLRA